MTTSMKKTPSKLMITAALITSLSTGSVFAESEYNLTRQQTAGSEQLSATDLKKQRQSNEEIGFGVGMVVGTVLAGPVGAVISAIAGNFIAKNINATQELEQLTLAYQQEKTNHNVALARYQEKMADTERAYQSEIQTLAQSYQNTSELQAENLLMSLQFSTGSSELKPHYHSQIVALADIARQSPHLTIDLSGYTDKQGSDELNQALSLARINAVKNALIDQGVTPERISLYAFGEQQPIVASSTQERSFYDRRVEIKLNNTVKNSITAPIIVEQTASNF